MKNNKILRKVYREKTVVKIAKKVKLLGVKYNYDVLRLLNIRLLICLVVFFLFIILSPLGYFYGPIATLILYFGLEYLFLDFRIKKRISKLDNEALFFFEVLTLTLESGRNLKNAIEMTTNNINSELSLEFKKALLEIKMGKSLNESLNSLKERIPSDTINNVILNITQSNIFGNSIIDSLYNQIDYLRDKKLMETKAIINKLPIKISIVSVIFFIPVLLLILLGPVLINLINNL